MKSAFFIFLILAAAPLWSQPETATLRGTVMDGSGAPVPGITLVVIEADTSLEVRRIATDSGGNYVCAHLKPGRYQVIVERRGYQPFVGEGVLLEPGQVRRLDPEILGAGTEDAAPMDLSKDANPPEAGAVDKVIDLKAQWHDIPVVHKVPSPFGLMTTVPGVQGNATGLVIGGISDRSKQTWRVDGIADDAVDGYHVHPAFYESVAVTTANPGVDTYRATGFDLISKRGTGSFHGLVYYKLGSSVLDSRQFFDTQKNKYTLHEQHGEVGGALFKDRTFFYGGWMHQGNRYSQTLFADVPTAKMRSGDFSQFLNSATSPTGAVTVIRDPRNNAPFPNNAIAGNRFSSVSSSFLSNYYPSPNIGDENTFLQNYTWDQQFGNDPHKGHWPILRLDHKLAESNNLYFRFMEAATYTVAPGTVGTALSSTQARKYKNFAVSDTQVIGSGAVNHFRFSYSVNRMRQGQEDSDVIPLLGDRIVSTTGLLGVNPNAYSTAGFPSIAIAGSTGLSMKYPGGKTDFVAQRDTVLTLGDSVSWQKGRHSVQIGGQFTRFNWLQGTIPQSNYGSFTFTGMFTGLGFADFLLGLPSTSSRVLNPKVDAELRQRQGGAWLSDSFRVTRRLTLDYGIRWDYFDSPVYDDGYMYNWDPATGTVIVAPGTLTAISSLFPKGIPVVVGDVVPKAKTTNFRPRISAAYRLTNNIVLRGGYGEFTDGGPFGAMGRVNDANGPYTLSETYFNSITNGVALYTFPRPFPTTLNAGLTGAQNITAVPMKTDEGVIRQYNATLERTANGLAMRVSYIGSRGSGMNYSLDTNKPMASAVPFAISRLPYQQFASTFVTRTDGEWRYNALQFGVRKPAGRVMFDSSFTWSDNKSNYANTFDPYTVTDRWVRDAANRRLYFATSASWPIPAPATSRIFGNWTLRAIGTIASGQYYSPLYTGPDSANASRGFVTALADCVGDPNAGARTIGQWFNPSAIAVPSPAAGRYGTCAMNSLEGYPIHVLHASIAKRIPIGDSASATFTIQASNVTNATHFTIPNNNISNPGAGAFTASSMVPSSYPERQGARQLDVKLRIQW